LVERAYRPDTDEDLMIVPSSRALLRCGVLAGAAWVGAAAVVYSRVALAWSEIRGGFML